MNKAWLSSNFSHVRGRANVAGPKWTHVFVNGEDHRAEQAEQASQDGAAITFMVFLRPPLSCLSLEGVAGSCLKCSP